jgi:hypothetical protein
MNARCWRKLAVLATVALIGQMANSQQRASVLQTTTFSAPDRAFLFSYPNDFQVCTAGKIDLCLHSCTASAFQTKACFWFVVHAPSRFQSSTWTSPIIKECIWPVSSTIAYVSSLQLSE